MERNVIILSHLTIIPDPVPDKRREGGCGGLRYRRFVSVLGSELTAVSPSAASSLHNSQMHATNTAEGTQRPQ